MSGRLGLLTAAIGAALSVAAPLPAQVTATTDVAFGAVKYEGFLGSAAASVTPAIRFDTPSFSVAGQGSYLVYESGNTLIQGTGAAAWLTPALGAFRGEMSGFGGLSRYASEPVTGYGLARGRVHLMDRTRGVWMGAGVGQTYTFVATAGTTEFGVGAWTTFPGLAFTVAATRNTAGGSAYLDAAVSARWLRGPIEVNGLVGVHAARDSSRTAAFGEILARLALTRRVAAQIALGEFAADPLRGGVAGRYLSAGLRLTFRDAATAVRAADERLRSELRLPFPLPADAPEIELVRSAFGVRALTVRGGPAERVEMAADFTDWQPVALVRSGSRTWSLPVTLPPGVYRLNVRVNGGAWQVPRGATPQRDEFGGLVGLLVIR